MRKLLVLLVAVGLVAAGCGGGGSSSTTPTGPPLTKAQYQAKLTSVAKTIGDSLTKTLGSGSNLDPKDLPKLGDALDAFANELAKINPPAAIKNLHEELVTDMHALAKELPKILGDAVKSKDPTAAIGALLTAKSIQNLAKLQQKFKAAGYDISSLMNADSGSG